MYSMADALINKPANGIVDPRSDVRTLLLAQKNELIGELTRAIANQFNNTMMAITSYAELEMRKAPATQRRNLDQVVSSAGRATALVQQLLSITRNFSGTPQLFDLNLALRK